MFLSNNILLESFHYQKTISSRYKETQLFDNIESIGTEK